MEGIVLANQASLADRSKCAGKLQRGDGCRVGCQVHFKVTKLLKYPEVAVLTYYNPTQHVDKAGSICHGPGCETVKNTRHGTYARVSASTKDFIVRKLQLGIPNDQILKDHCTAIEQDYVRQRGGPLVLDEFLDVLQRETAQLYRFAFQCQAQVSYYIAAQMC